MSLLLLLVISIVPQWDGVVRESVDLIEHNFFYDDNGRLVFEQVIFYDWSWAESRYNVRAWRLVKDPSQLPQRDWPGSGYRAMWLDGGQVRYIHSKSIRETWEQYDPELVERQYLPKEMRRELKSTPAIKRGKL